jgi:hypothetical protein
LAKQWLKENYIWIFVTIIYLWTALITAMLIWAIATKSTIEDRIGVIIDWILDYPNKKGGIIMESIKLQTLYSTNEDFRNYVNKCAKTYRKTVDEVLSMATTREYAEYCAKGGEVNGRGEPQ